jgi:hypothetical protein
MSGQPRVSVRPRRTYAEVVVDLWPCDYDLNEEGARLCRNLLEKVALRTATKKRHVLYSAGGSIAQITRVRRAEADEVVSGLLEIILDERHQEPLRPFWDDA